MEKKSKHFKTTFYILTRENEKPSDDTEKVKSKVLYNIFVSLMESKFLLSHAESAMYTPHRVPVSPDAI